jgi:hypothetical protein
LEIVKALEFPLNPPKRSGLFGESWGENGGATVPFPTEFVDLAEAGEKHFRGFGESIANLKRLPGLRPFFAIINPGMFMHGGPIHRAV